MRGLEVRRLGGKEKRDERGGGGGSMGGYNCTLDAPLWWQGRRERENRDEETEAGRV